MTRLAGLVGCKGQAWGSVHLGSASSHIRSLGRLMQRLMGPMSFSLWLLVCEEFLALETFHLHAPHERDENCEPPSRLNNMHKDSFIPPPLIDTVSNSEWIAYAKPRDGNSDQDATKIHIRPESICSVLYSWPLRNRRRRARLFAELPFGLIQLLRQGRMESVLKYSYMVHNKCLPAL